MALVAAMHPKSKGSSTILKKNQLDQMDHEGCGRDRLKREREREREREKKKGGRERACEATSFRHEEVHTGGCSMCIP
jgi:hypothetical protein